MRQLCNDGVRSAGRKLLEGRIGHIRNRLALWCLRRLTPYGVGSVPWQIGLYDCDDGRTFAAFRFTHEPTGTVVVQALMTSDEARRVTEAITRQADRIDEERSARNA